MIGALWGSHSDWTSPSHKWIYPESSWAENLETLLNLSHKIHASIFSPGSSHCSVALHLIPAPSPDLHFFYIRKLVAPDFRECWQAWWYFVWGENDSAPPTQAGSPFTQWQAVIRLWMDSSSSSPHTHTLTCPAASLHPALWGPAHAQSQSQQIIK